MSQQGPVIVVSATEPSPLAAALTGIRMFPMIETCWSDAVSALGQVQPAAVLTLGGAEPQFAAFAAEVAKIEPYVPLVVINPIVSLPPNALPFELADGDFARLDARLRAALRVRALHATVLRRIAHGSSTRTALTDTDPVDDTTVLLIGRGASYPALSVALGERMGVVGAFSIEAAAKHLNLRDLDGIVLGEGFSARVVDAFLTVLAEDTRFRNLPVIVATSGPIARCDLPNLERVAGDPMRVASNALPMVRQHAFESRLRRTLQSIDAGGLLDCRTGLLTLEAFNRNFTAAVAQTQTRGGALSAARFCFDRTHPRLQLDGARIISRLMRRTDFGAAHEDSSIVVVFTETDLRSAHMIARRLASVMKHTIHGRGELRLDPEVTVTAVLPSDSAQAALARLAAEARRAAS